MEMQTNLSGRLRNTSLPISSGLLPLFEAVVNSIHGIEEASSLQSKGKIRVEIVRRPSQPQFESFGDKSRKLDDIIGFKVNDNGIGFTDDNMTSFQTLDSEYKISKGGRGVGRLLWLKAFKKVYVRSIFQNNDDKLMQRSFELDPGGVRNEELVAVSVEIPKETEVHLSDFEARYRNASFKSLQAIADSILEHCLWYFVRPGGAPEIEVWDNGESVSLDNILDGKMHSEAVPDEIDIKGTKFELVHVKLRSRTISGHAIAYCADNRLVMEETLTGKLPGLHGKISDEKGDFVYECYISSPFLDRTARPERTGFDIAENPIDSLLDSELSLSQIRSAVIEKAARHLKPHLDANLVRSRDRIERFVARKAPRYRPILKRIPPERLNYDPEMSDKELELALHKHLAEIESELLAEGHDLMAPAANETKEEYSKRLAAYLGKAEDIKKSDLANYVAHRKVILDLFAKAIQRNTDGSYVREDLIHSLIMPMGTTSDEIHADASNLWLINERLAFHNYLASDKTLSSMPITDSPQTKEPDLCCLSVYDNPLLVAEGANLPLASIVVVEIKKPMRNDAAPGEEKDPVEQAIGYLTRIRNGEVRTATGRPIPESQDVPGFCYVLADLTPTLKQRCRIHHDLRPTHDKMGFFGYKQNVNAYIEVISFDGLVNSAKERNRAFFDKLGLPTN